MKFSRKQQASFKLTEEGYYHASILDIKELEPQENLLYGETPCVDVYFELNEGQRLKQRMLVYAGSNSLFEKLVDSTVGEVEEITVHELIGHTCGVEVAHNLSKGKTFANVVDVFSEALFEDQDDQVELPE